MKDVFLPQTKDDYEAGNKAAKHYIIPDVQEQSSPDTRPRRGQVYVAVLTSFLAGFFRAGDFFGIPALKTS